MRPALSDTQPTLIGGVYASRGYSSAGRAPGLHPGGLRFDPA